MAKAQMTFFKVLSPLSNKQKITNCDKKTPTQQKKKKRKRIKRKKRAGQTCPY
jgi:hypothetical protein